MASLGAVGYNIGLEPIEVPVFGVSQQMALDYIVSGIIKDDTDTETARTVRLIDRATGRFIGETVSDSGDGSFSMKAPADEVQRIVLDDDAGTLYNDLIDRVIPG